jgi:DNA polymerase-3 subunit epsilon
MNFFWKRERPQLIQSYIDATRPKTGEQTNLEDCKLIALDSETSGFDIGRDVILSLAFQPIEELKLPVAKIQNWLVKQPKHRPNQATAIHGILPEESRSGLTEAELIEAFLPTISGAILIGHHARFDASVLNELLMRHHHTRLYNRFIDTAEIAMVELDAFKKTGYANQRPPSLDEVCAQLDLPMLGRHTAAGDAFTTAELFLILSARRRRRLGRKLQLRDFHLQKL